MPFAYFQRLTRRQQAIYLKSDGVTAVPLAQPERFRPLVVTLARALERDDRPGVEQSAQQLAAALGQALGAPAVTVRVLAARPHARWGELHGLYESPGAPRRAPAHHALDAHRAAEARGRVPHLPAHAPARAGAPRRLHGPAARRLIPHPGLLPARIVALSPTRHRRRHPHGDPRRAARPHGPHRRRLRRRPPRSERGRAVAPPGRHELVSTEVDLPRPRHRGVVHAAIREHDGQRRAAVPARRARPLGGGAPVPAERRCRGARAPSGRGATRRSKFLHGLRPEHWERGGSTPRAGG